MSAFIGGLIGSFIGSFLTMILIALCFAGRDDDRREY